MSQPTTELNPLSNHLSNQAQLLTAFQQKLLTKSLQTDLRPEYRQRIEIMLLANQGYSQSQICETLGCCHQTARYWISMAQAGKAHQWGDRQMGRPKTVDERYLNRLKELVSHSPRECGYPFQRWTAQWLKKHLAKETKIEVTEQHINRLLREMGLATRSRSQLAEPPTEHTNLGHTNLKQSDTEQPGIIIRDLQQIASPDDSSLLLNLAQMKQ
jgi:transposase